MWAITIDLSINFILFLHVNVNQSCIVDEECCNVCSAGCRQTHCGKIQLVRNRGPTQWGVGFYMQLRSEACNDLGILSHWQLLWHLGIYLLQHIFTGVRRHLQASWVHLTCCTSRNSCERWSQRHRNIWLCGNAPSSTVSAALQPYRDLFTSHHGCNKPLKPAGVSYWQFDTYKAKVNAKCGAINSFGSLACCFDTRSWRLIMRDE